MLSQTACVIVILLVIAYLVYTERIVERYEMGIIGNGLRGNLPYDSGADLRFATEFTGTNQQPYSTPRNADVKAIAAALAASGDPVSGAAVRDAMKQSGGRERLTGEPAHMYMCPCSKCGRSFDDTSKDLEHYTNRPADVRCNAGTPCLNRGLSDAAVTGLVRVENLVGQGQSPVFWDISPELGKYRDDDRDDYFGLGN